VQPLLYSIQARADTVFFFKETTYACTYSRHHFV
jgi:hypothetical protein